MKIIFLDIDGVLNSSTGKGPYESDMETEKIILLKKLIDEASVDGVVISSDRRYSKIDMSHKKKIFDFYQMKIVGYTRRPKDIFDDPDDNRGKQIMDYLCCSNDGIDKMLILDDNDDGISNIFPEVFIKTNSVYGFNADVYNDSLRILNN